MEQIFFDNWAVLFRTMVVGVLAYLGLVIILRVSGKRTLSRMNAFDLIVTVALGSTLASILVSKDVPLAQGMLAFSLLVGLQYIITWSSVRMQWVRRIVTGEPTLILHRGEFLSEALRRTRVNQDDVRAAIRAAGLPSPQDVEAVVLETDGSFSVVRTSTVERTGSSSLTGVELGRRVDCAR